jgi:pyruvate ferredoxin oxidoreductase gamma subunit
VTNPGIVIVLDPTLMETVNIIDGMPADGILLINTARSPADIRKESALPPTIKIYTVDASAISKETIGRDIPNMPMLGALVKATGILDFKDMLDDTRKKLEKKFKSKPEVAEGNMKAIERAYNEVKN